MTTAISEQNFPRTSMPPAGSKAKRAPVRKRQVLPVTLEAFREWNPVSKFFG